jgi:hypothetical protein
MSPAPLMAMSVPAMVLAARLKQLANPNRKTIFHALECEKDAFPTYAKYLLTSDDFEVCRHRVSIDTFRKYKLSIATAQSIATYRRLAIPQLIEKADRVLYLDCDPSKAADRRSFRYRHAGLSARRLPGFAPISTSSGVTTARRARAPWNSSGIGEINSMRKSC